MTAMTYEAPAITMAEGAQNEAVPAFILAAAPVLGVSAGYIVWVCQQCVRTDCNSFNNTVLAVRRWWGDGC